MASIGWPFLIGRGRRTGHKVLLAPDFLIAAQDHGILEGISGNNVMKLGPLTVRSATHQVEARDVNESERPRDEHGRPLRLIYGVLARGIEPANADLPNALAAALTTYRRFLNAEEEFTVESSQGFPLSARPSTVDHARPPTPHRPARARARVAVLSASTTLVAVLAVGSTILIGQSAREPAPTSPLPPPPPSCTSTQITPTTTQGKVVCIPGTSTTGRKP